MLTTRPNWRGAGCMRLPNPPETVCTKTPRRVVIRRLRPQKPRAIRRLRKGIEAGRLDYKGPHNPATEYSFNDLVSANGGSYAYINPTPSTGVPSPKRRIGSKLRRKVTPLTSKAKWDDEAEDAFFDVVEYFTVHPMSTSTRYRPQATRPPTRHTGSVGTSGRAVCRTQKT